MRIIRPGTDTEWLDMSSGTEAEDNEKHKHITKEMLMSSMQMQNIVILAGSGTSLGENAGPSMGDLWKACTKLDNEYTKQAKAIFDVINYDIKDNSKINIEELLSICESYLQVNASQQILVKEFINSCKKTILEKCRFDKQQGFLERHKTFIHRLSRRRSRDTRLNIFTTNYDTAFETAAGELGIVVIDGFSFASPRRYDPRFFDYDIVRRNQHNDSDVNYLEGVFKLFKLHGSVNWEKDTSGHIVENNFVEAENSCMIFPARGKYQQSYIQPHLELMARYLAVLREPNTCLIVLGFGFNDNHLSEPILSAIKSNPHLKVIVVNPQIQSNIDNKEEYGSPYWGRLNSYRENGYDIFFIEATFEEFSRLIPDLTALTPAEKIEKSIKQISGEPYEF